MLAEFILQTEAVTYKTIIVTELTIYDGNKTL